MNDNQENSQSIETQEEQNTEHAEVNAEQADTNAASHTEVEGSAEDSQQPVEQDELERLSALAEENNQRYLRTQADFENFRRRTRQEKEELAKYASSKVLEQLVSVLDNFERALAASKDNQDFESFAKGVDMIFRQFDSVLTSEGLTAIESVGQPFNPEFHQAIMQVETDEHEEGTVVEELQKGYRLKDKVLRPAMVKVSTRA
ncbi:molecular chaperone GrpE [Paenibacillus swuensis]|uniref:Protein GrpE n=1 Tax=Paenibacillus swuensis TaxID=1178515 RepID=A0A172TQ52_9BACL|nr:nucleotide exchange factor GrpE [Paenibacillus swuensis]ANE48937.1 molecular chaperone GrpE [Paenibacillus swuensis]